MLSRADGPTFRAERPDDHHAVEQLHVAAFGPSGRAVAGLVAELRAGPATERVSLVAVDGGAVVGHVMLSPCLIDAARGLVPALLLSPLAVRRVNQGRGIGTRLVREALHEAAARHAPAVILEGDPAFYGRVGFESARRHGLRRPSLRIPPDAFQVHPLGGFETWMSGTVVYPDIWWRRDLVGLRPEPGGAASSPAPSADDAPGVVPGAPFDQ